MPVNRQKGAVSKSVHKSKGPSQHSSGSSRETLHHGALETRRNEATRRYQLNLTGVSYADPVSVLCSTHHLTISQASTRKLGGHWKMETAQTSTVVPATTRRLIWEICQMAAMRGTSPHWHPFKTNHSRMRCVIWSQVGEWSSLHILRFISVQLLVDPGITVIIAPGSNVCIGFGKIGSPCSPHSPQAICVGSTTVQSQAPLSTEAHPRLPHQLPTMEPAIFLYRSLTYTPLNPQLTSREAPTVSLPWKHSSCTVT